jgi:hypothetical protein
MFQSAAVVSLSLNVVCLKKGEVLFLVVVGAFAATVLLSGGKLYYPSKSKHQFNGERASKQAAQRWRDHNMY